MTKRPRIAEDFFDSTFAGPQNKPAPSNITQETKEAAKPEPPEVAVETKEQPPQVTSPKVTREARQPKPAKPITTPNDAGKVRTTLYIREELHEKARWAILNLENAPRSISQLIENALERELERLGRLNGTAIERHRLALPGGRPRITT